MCLMTAIGTLLLPRNLEAELSQPLSKVSTCMYVTTTTIPLLQESARIYSGLAYLDHLNF